MQVGNELEFVLGSDSCVWLCSLHPPLAGGVRNLEQNGLLHLNKKAIVAGVCSGSISAKIKGRALFCRWKTSYHFGSCHVILDQLQLLCCIIF